MLAWLFAEMLSSSSTRPVGHAVQVVTFGDATESWYCPLGHTAQSRGVEEFSRYVPGEHDAVQSVSEVAPGENTNLPGGQSTHRDGAWEKLRNLPSGQ